MAGAQAEQLDQQIGGNRPRPAQKSAHGRTGGVIEARIGHRPGQQSGGACRGQQQQTQPGDLDRPTGHKVPDMVDKPVLIGLSRSDHAHQEP